MRISDREYNRLRVLKALRRAEPIGRTELALLCNLDGGTITEISSTLLDRSLILEEKIATGKRGRPQRHLRLNPQGSYGLGAYISINGELICETVNLRGDRIHLSAFALSPTHSMADLSEQMGKLIAEAIARNGLDKSALACVGLALPAVVDSRTGTLHWVQTMPATPYPAKLHIEAMVGIPVFIDNNTNVLARAEHWFGDGEGRDDFSLFNLGYGISAAHYSGGDLILGVHGLNSEAGHSKIVAEAGRTCTCGARGCLDAYCSIVALVEQGCEALSLPMASYPDMPRVLHELVARSRDGHENLSQVFERAKRYFGTVLGNHINSYDPGRIIVLCEHEDLPDLYAGALPYIDECCLPPMRGMTNIEFRSFEHDLFRKGAAALVLEQLYKTL